MIVIDSSGWIEYFTNGPLADDYEPSLLNPSEIITPAIVIYEFYKRVKRKCGEYNAELGLMKMSQTVIVPLDEQGNRIISVDNFQD